MISEPASRAAAAHERGWQVVALATALALAGCAGPPPREELGVDVRLTPRDFRTDFAAGGEDANGPPEWRGTLAVVWSGSLGSDRELMREATRMIGDGLYLVELASGEPVAGDVVDGVVRVDGEVVEGYPDGGSLALGAVSFVPAAPLPEGWYVLVADLRAWSRSGVPTTPAATESQVEDEMMFARFRIGSAPVWYASGADCGQRPTDEAPWCRAWVSLSEPVETLGASPFELRVNGEVDPGCAGGDAAVWDCPFYPEGTEFELELLGEGEVRPLDGVTVQTLIGGGSASPRELVAPRFGVDVARAAR